LRETSFKKFLSIKTTMTGRVVFITGGARSGKSSFALDEASRAEGKKAFIATAEPLDEEMRQRIESHRAERGPGWITFEEPLEVPRLLNEMEGYDVVLLDCLTLWLSNLMLAGRDFETESENMLAALKSAKKSVWVVSNEVGMGIVPENETARRFGDLAGRLNRAVAEISDEAYLVVSGMPLRLK
jgi:adenosyl cobinamide kinase/adenosyl cobinamide phosphate guanylyltransferase